MKTQKILTFFLIIFVLFIVTTYVNAEGNNVDVATSTEDKKIILTLDDGYAIVSINGDYESNTKVDVTIGNVKDTKILTSIKNGEADSLQKLLEYARNDEGIYKKQLEVGTNYNFCTDIELNEEYYYYAYLTIKGDSEENVVEDVSLYQGIEIKKEYEPYSPEMDGIYLVDYSEPKFNWAYLDVLIENEENNNSSQLPETDEPAEDITKNEVQDDSTIIEEETNVSKEEITKEPTTLPNTGEAESIIFKVLIVTVIVISIVCFIKLREYKKIK